MDIQNGAFCQCCGMPMDANAVYGTEADEQFSKDYCSYCYQDGKFTFNGTMDEMIDLCVPMMVEHNEGMTKEAAKKICKEFFPTLKRWKK